MLKQLCRKFVIEIQARVTTKSFYALMSYHSLLNSIKFCYALADLKSIQYYIKLNIVHTYDLDKINLYYCDLSKSCHPHH